MNWSNFNRWCARHSTRGQIRGGDGIEAAWSHSKLLINNLTMPSGPVAGAADLQARGAAAAADAAPYGLA